MGFLDRLFGGNDADRQSTQTTDQRWYAERGTTRTAPRDARSDEQVALERYRYLLRTAPPERIEQAHAEAFGHLTTDQRRRVFVGLARELPAEERPLSADPDDLARAATRAELRSPGSVERLLMQPDVDVAPEAAGLDGMSGSSVANNGYRGQGGPSFGSMFASSLLGSVAGYVIGSAIMSAFIPNDWGDTSADGSADEGSGDSADAAADSGDAGGSDAGGYDTAGADSGWGGDGGGWGDFGGGDFGGGDFGGFDI